MKKVGQAKHRKVFASITSEETDIEWEGRGDFPKAPKGRFDGLAGLNIP